MLYPEKNSFSTTVYIKTFNSSAANKNIKGDSGTLVFNLSPKGIHLWGCH
jgi:hypothetical protein